MKVMENFNAYFPPLERERLAAAGIQPKETTDACGLLGDAVWFLGQIPRTTEFEQGAPNLFYEAAGEERRDTFEDDTALVAHVKDKGLVVLSGCAHSGIVNTVRHARQVSGIEHVHAVMGGFHLSGPGTGPLVEATVAALKEIDPDYVVPTHCTGRKAAQAFETAMPDKFILNMSGTKLVFGV